VVVSFEGNTLVEKKIQTQEIKAGDIIKMTGRTSVPADLILILTSNYKDGNQCYIETANIDGETNLKVREAPSALSTLINANGTLSKNFVEGKIEFEPPNKNIHTFIGALTLNALSEPIALSPENVLLRSSLFSNTEWGYGVAIYCGQETKVQMNNRMASSKMSKLEGYANNAIMVIFIVQLCVVTFAVIGLYALNFDKLSNYPYIFPDGTTVSVLPLWLEQWFTLFILYNNFIPISLYVTLEMVNIGQAMLISYDKEIYEDSIDAPCSVKSSNMCQELGMISNVFSDKTGTLTRNVMKFVKFIIAGKVYDVPSDPVSGPASGSGSDVFSTPNPINESKKNSSKKVQQPNQKQTVNKTLTSETEQNFIKCLTVCHTVVREKDGTYRAESPDELALVEGVGPYGCGLLERGTTSMKVEFFGQIKTYDILAVNAFDADRKRMSILVK
jgi:magnesium-transporting ATPase (P-type)